jgi:hypothetical protein
MTTHIRKIGLKRVTTTSECRTTTRYSNPRELQVLLHFYYRNEPISDATFWYEILTLQKAGMMTPSSLASDCSLTPEGVAWVVALLAVKPPPMRHRRKK